MRFIGKLTLPILFAFSSFAQQFEVASIRPSTNDPQGQVNVGVHIDGSQVHVAALTLKDYLGIAYRTNISHVLGPEWIGSERFDISATIPAGVSTSKIPEMFLALLTDRFQLRIHREKKEFPVYALVLGKGDLKLKEVPPDKTTGKPAEPVDIKAGGSAAGVSVNLGNGSSWSFVPNKFEVHKLAMDEFAAQLERFADRQIIDMTGLKGQYDFTFDINPDDYQPMLIRSAIAAGVVLPPQALRYVEGTNSAGLSDALQQVGLKLDARKAPLDVIVVDDGRKTPTEN